MRVFLRSLGHEVWSIIEEGWIYPTEEVDQDGIKTIVRKDKIRWSDGEKARSECDAKALNVIYCVVSENEFKRICTCETTKQAWIILETTHEGTNTVKRSKLQLLMTEFENIKMNDQETFMEFYSRLNDICNSMWGLGEKISEARICRKIL